MTHFDRLLVAALATGIWTLIGSQMISDSQAEAQESPAVEQPQDARAVPPASRVINATEIVGLTAVVSQVIRDSQIRPQTISGLDQHIRSVVRGCRVNGSVSGGRLSSASISC